MDFWRNFNAAEVNDDFALLADLRLTMVRLFLLWDDFQPDPARKSDGLEASGGGGRSGRPLSIGHLFSPAT